MNLRTLEGITILLSMERGVTHSEAYIGIANYIEIKQKEHPQRDKITLAREYLAKELMYNNGKERTSN